MDAEQSDRFVNVLDEVSGWPSDAQRSLATRILSSLDEDQRIQSFNSAAELVGAWKIERPPTDGDVERILEEEKLRKYG